MGHIVSLLRDGSRPKSEWILEWIIEGAPDKITLAANANAAAPQGVKISEKDLEIQEIPPDTDWLAQVYKQFPPFSVGPFFIHGSHYKDKIPETQIDLQIDAATAFGSGEHGTTKGCLTAMLDLKAAGACPWNVLDMGTGSGILGLAAFKLWKTPVLAIDNDPECVRVADVHRVANKVPGDATGFIALHGDGFRTPEVLKRKPFDLIIANILAGPLRDMADDLIGVLDENGYVILSGILNEQADSVIEAYKNLKLKKHEKIGEWSTLTLQNALA